MTPPKPTNAARPAPGARSELALDPARDALFLDFDGTLAEIVEHPADVSLSDPRRAVLTALGPRFGGALAIVSGRALDELSRHTCDTLWRIGSHGGQIAGPGESGAAEPAPVAPALLAAADTVTNAFPGVIVETKPCGLALHYRQAPEAREAVEAAMKDAVAADSQYALQHGKMVVEAKPRNANKGDALRRMMAQAPFAGRRPVMVGDDLTDEAAMTAAMEFGGAGVKVGEGDSVAEYRLDDPDAVFDWLERHAMESAKT